MCVCVRPLVTIVLFATSDAVAGDCIGHHRPSPLLLRKTDVGSIMTICFLHPTELDDINVATVVLSFCSLAAIAVLPEAGLAEQHHDAFRRTSTELPLT